MVCSVLLDGKIIPHQSAEELGLIVHGIATARANSYPYIDNKPHRVPGYQFGQLVFPFAKLYY